MHLWLVWLPLFQLCSLLLHRSLECFVITSFGETSFCVYHWWSAFFVAKEIWEMAWLLSLDTRCIQQSCTPSYLKPLVDHHIQTKGENTHLGIRHQKRQSRVLKLILICFPNTNPITQGRIIQTGNFSPTCNWKAPGDSSTCTAGFSMSHSISLLKRKCIHQLVSWLLYTHTLIVYFPPTSHTHP